VNNSPTRFFGSSRGLRQWDLLSPLLFVIVMEALDRMISPAATGGLLSGFFVGTRTDISHVLLVDHTLIFSGADPNHLRNLRGLILCFEAVSGLKMTLAKSELVPIGNVDSVTELARILGFEIASLPLKYLGLPLGASHKAKHI